ncbi:MAG: metallophosphoesterase [Oscillospiraceae bacterium]|nr:metallophosphoesterase [Oscillospiraceae bacterium]
MKRILSTILALIIILSCFAGFSASASEKVALKITPQANLDKLNVSQTADIHICLTNVSPSQSVQYDAYLSSDSVGQITKRSTVVSNGATILNIQFRSQEQGIVKLYAKATISGTTYQDFISFEVQGSQKPIMSFGVSSDMHIGGGNTQYENEKKLENALKQYNKLIPKASAMVFVGDLTNRGTVAQYSAFNRIVDRNLKNTKNEIYTMGNHEYFNTKPSYNTGSIWADSKALGDFKSNMKVKDVYGEQIIDGYQFIYLSGDNMWINGNENQDDALISDQQYTWLENTLKKVTDPKKPIFMFLHQALNDTVAGSNFYHRENNNIRLYNILKNYPQVILFSGHSHLTAKNQNTVFQEAFTMVNTSSVGDVWDRNFAIKDKSEGVVVDVYSDKVVIKHRDFALNEWVNMAVVDTPYTPKTYQKIAPVLNEESLELVINKDKSINVNFAAAKGNYDVEKYTVVMNGTKVLDYYIDTTLQQVLKTLQLRINWFEADKSHTFEVYATDIYGNKSNVIKADIKTPFYSGFNKLGGKLFYFDPTTLTSVVGRADVGGKVYWFNSDGSIKTGWIYDKGNTIYYCTESGCLKNTFKEINGKTYYFNGYSIMQKGWVTVNGKMMYFDCNGALTNM